MFYRRRLPHWQPAGASIFITWRLHGSLPESAILRLRETQRLLRREIERPNETADQRRLRHHKKVFVGLDRILDAAEEGPLWLKQPEIGDLIEEALLRKYCYLYRLWAYAVMPNHVHVLLQPKQVAPTSVGDDVAPTSVGDSIFPRPQTKVCATYPIEEITKRLKGYTALEANRILNRTGQTFWQRESFDHWVRDRAEFLRIVAYIENNPVNARLVESPGSWKWSSASERLRRGWHDVQALT